MDGFQQEGGVEKAFMFSKSNGEGHRKLEMDPFSNFTPLHETDNENDPSAPVWYLNSLLNRNSFDEREEIHSPYFYTPLNQNGESIPSPVQLDMDSSPDSVYSPFPPKAYLPSLLSAICNSSSFDPSLDLLTDSSGFLSSLQDTQSHFAGINPIARPVDSYSRFLPQNPGAPLSLPWVEAADFNPLPLEDYGKSTVVSHSDPPFIQRSLFSSHHDSGKSKGKEMLPIHDSLGLSFDKGKAPADQELSMFMVDRSLDETKREISDSPSIDNYYFFGDNANHVLDISHGNSSIISGEEKGTKTKTGRLPAKNLMAERRRRKKLNDRLFMLRSIVPKISKMDRASILADAVDYLNELLQRIKNLNEEVQSMAAASSMQSNISPFQPTSSAPLLPYPIKEEPCKDSPLNLISQTPMVNVEVREGNVFSVHMLCARRPGLLLSSIRALENLGLDIHQAVISCFNGFALDIFRAENGDRGIALRGDQIKATLVDAATMNGVIQ